ncbi:YSIRK-type signal peptide-containing protein, partial [Streptococcus sp. 1032]|uniref:YSIRK-type signal peptide-containing protein n=2 Tax=unclassified Streptococcus TaxID=2608887 RepID=UPI001566174F
MRKSYRDDNGEKIYRYSIRKYHFGAASVAVAALMFFANGVQAQAPAVSPVTASDVVAGPSGNSDGDPQDSDEENPEKTAVVEQPVDLKSAGESSAPEAKAEEGSQEESEAEVKSPQPETKIDDKEEAPQVAKEKDQEVSAPVADTSAAKSTQSTLEALLANLTLDSMKALHIEVEEGLAKAKAVLENPKATQAQVDEQVKLMEDLTRRVREALSPQVSTPPVLEKAGLTNTTLAAPEGTVLTPKEAVTKVLEKNPVASTNGEVRTPSTKLSKSEVSDNQNKEKLKAISKDLSAYLIQANEITRPETKKLLEGVEEIVKSIEASVLQPQLTPAEIEELLKKGKQAEKKLALALTREKSGKRDLRNGSRMARGADFRANPTGPDTKRAYIVQNEDGSGLPAETYLYAMERGINSNPDSDNVVPVRDVLGRAKMLVKNNGNGKYTWTVTFNGSNQGGTNDFYWFTLPEGHKITKSLAITRIYGGRNFSIGGDDFNNEWRSDGKLKTVIGEGKRAVHGSAKGPFDFNTKFNSLRDVTNSLINPKVVGNSPYDTEDPANYSNKDKYYYLGELSHKFIPKGIPGTAVPNDVREKAARNIEGMHKNTEHLYHFTSDNGTITITYETQTEKPYAPLYYAAGMRTIEHNVAKMYFMARGLQEKPNAPTVTPNNEGTVTVTPYSGQNQNVDMVGISYRNQDNEEKTITLTRNPKDGTWTSSGDGKDGIQINGNSFSVKAGYAKAGTEVSAISYFGNSDASDRHKATVPTDTQPPVVRINGVTLPETSPSDAIYTVTQGELFAPNLEAFDNTGKITKFEIGGGSLPTGVSLSNNVSSTANYTETSPYRPTFTGNVPNNFTPGSYTRTITVNDGKTGDKTYHFKYKVLPKAPMVTTETKYNGTLVSTDRSISGTGHPGATITVTLQNGTTGTTTVGPNGQWTYRLKDSEMLTQNDKQDATTKSENPVKIKQSLNEAESAETRVDVKLARAISINTPVQAGRDITVKIPHDAGLFYVQVKRDNRTVYQYDIKKVDGNWKLIGTGNAQHTDLIVQDGNTVSEKILTFRIKDKKNNIPFTLAANDDVTMRVHYDNDAGNPSDPANENGGWVTAAKPTNINPTINVNEPNRHNYTADGSLTIAGLKGLVTATDQEDDANKTVGRTAKENLTVTVKQGNQNIDLSGNNYLKKGTYTLTYETRDAAGVSVTKEHTITVSSLAESKGASIIYPADAAKVVYGNSGVENGNFKQATKQSFADKLKEVNRSNNSLPTINGTSVTFAPGATDDKTKVVVARFPDGSTLDIPHGKVAKPEAPTVTPKGAYAASLDSTERSISGTGIAGATVKITLQNNKEVTTTVGTDGNWKYDLKADEVLTQNVLTDNTSGYKSNPVVVKQEFDGVASGETRKNVLIGFPTLENSVAAGRDINFTLPKDVGLAYLQLNNNSNEEIAVKKVNGTWQIDGRFKDKLTLETDNQSNPSITKFHISVKDPKTESNIPFRLQAGENKLRLRMHKADAAGNSVGNSSQIYVGENQTRADWVRANVTNTKPTITNKVDSKDTYVASDKLTRAKLLELMVATDVEDDNNKTVGQTANQKLTVTSITKDGKAFNLNDTDYLKKGSYVVTYGTSDAAGTAADSVTRTIVVKSIADVTTINLTQKEPFNASDVADNGFTDAVRGRFVEKIKQQNQNLPTTARVEKMTDAGFGNVAKITFEDDSYKVVTGTEIAVPVAPTFTGSREFGNDLGSIERRIAGTGIPGATVKIALQNNKEVTTRVGANGNWEYELRNDELLTQNEKQDAKTKAAKGVSIKQEISGMTSASTLVKVRLGEAKFEETPVQAGRDIVVRVPHDASRFYVIIASKDGSKYQYGINKTDNGWQVEEQHQPSGSSTFTATGKTTTDFTEERSTNPAEKVFKLHIKDTHTKNDIPFTIPSSNNSVIARVHYDNEANNPSGDYARATATNTLPTIDKKPDTKEVYHADGTLTLAALKNLVTVSDAEDTPAQGQPKTVGEGTLTVSIQKDGETITLGNNDYLKEGTYTITYSAVDAAGNYNNQGNVQAVTKQITVTVKSLKNVYESGIKNTSVVLQKDDIQNGELTQAAKQKLVTELQKVNTQLPTNTIITVSKGNDVNNTVEVTYSDGTKTQMPLNRLATINRPTINGTLTDADRTVSGTSLPNATVTLTLQNDNSITTTANSNGEWSVSLQNGQYLRKNDASNTKTLNVKQTFKNLESGITSANIAEGRTFEGLSLKYLAGSSVTISPTTALVYKEQNNKKSLPNYLTVEWKTAPNTTTVGDSTATLVVKEKNVDNTTTKLTEVTVPVTVYPTAVAKQSSFPTVSEKDHNPTDGVKPTTPLPQGKDAANYIQFKNENNGNINKPDDVTVGWESKPVTTTPNPNQTGRVKITYTITNADGQEVSNSEYVDVKVPVLHVTPIKTEVVATFGGNFESTSNNSSTYYNHNGNDSWTSSVWKSSSNNYYSEYATYTRSADKQKANYLGKVKDRIRAYVSDTKSQNWNLYEEFDVTFTVKPITPTVEGATTSATSLTVNNVNSGTTVELYDVTDTTKDPVKIGEKVVAKEGNYDKKDNISVPLTQGQTLAAGRKIIAKVVYTSGNDKTESDDSSEVVIKHPKPAELTSTTKMNGETEINIPTDADEVMFSISKDNGSATKVVAKKSENWSLSNGLISKSPDNTWKFGSHEDGTYTITAVATAGNGETKSDETTTVITSNSHKVTKVDIVKKPTDTLSGEDLHTNTGVVGITVGSEEKDYASSNIHSVTSKEALPALTAGSTKDIPVTITYTDGSSEDTTVKLKVTKAAPTAPTVGQWQN